MKRLFASFALASASLLAVPTNAQDPAAAMQAAGAAAPDMSRVSYAFGMQFAREMGNFDVQLDPEAFAKAMNDVYTGAESELSEEQMMTTLREFQTFLQRKRAEQQAAAQTQNLAQARAFLEENAQRDGVTTTGSGLQYEVMTEGDGTSPAATDTVRVHYRGTLLDGTQFDSSYDRGEPAEFPLNGVIPGWTEGLQLMKEGAKYKFYIPPDLAYGEAGRPGIPPNSLLTFEVELLEVVQ